MRDDLPAKIKRKEAGIVNLDSETGDGTHWVTYFKCDTEVKYFDSVGNLQPPTELINYFHSDGNRNKIVYNSTRYQSPNSYNCGHLCLRFLYINTRDSFRQC